MKVKHLFILSSMVSTLFSACGEKESCCGTIPSADYSKGIFVVNEGPFGGTGTISWHNPDSGETQDSLFEKANNGAELGQFVQSLSIYNGKAYIVVNGANRLVVVDAHTFQYLDTIGGMAMPRYFLPVDNHTALVSQWGLDGVSGSVAKVDLNTGKILKLIPTGSGPDKMVRVNDIVYVANAGGYGEDASITEINLSNDQAQNLPIPAGKNPSSLVWYDQHLFYLCKGYFQDMNPEGLLNSFPNAALGLAAPPYSDDLALDPELGDLYFIGGGNVYKTLAGSLQQPLQLLFTQPAYGLGFDPTLKLLYCADAKDFSSPGEVVVYQTDGTKVGAFRSGIAPGEVVIVR